LNLVNQSAYSNTGRQQNTTYYYRVRTFNADGTSAWSNTASATTPATIPAVPAGMTVIASAPNSLVISWTYTSNGAPGPITFQVQRSLTGIAGTWNNVANGITATTFTNTGLPANALRYYRVRAVNALGNSAWVMLSGTTLP
jgi:predicted phage tail protein